MLSIRTCMVAIVVDSRPPKVPPAVLGTDLLAYLEGPRQLVLLHPRPKVGMRHGSLKLLANLGMTTHTHIDRLSIAGVHPAHPALAEGVEVGMLRC